ncbi:MAG: sulfatase-like hydrolase/transferase [Acidimicrobiia bacterium]|nr:sulfatase-like hydrolase/transferase [Acidimicrobiia bacterium]
MRTQRATKSCALALLVLLVGAMTVGVAPLMDSRADAQGPQMAENVLMIMIDDSNDWFGYLGGHPQAQTPNIDALAAQSTSFRNASTDAPWCNPARTSVALGLRPASTGILSNDPSEIAWRDEFDRVDSTAYENYGPGIGDIRTMYGHFNDQGYDVSLLGKIHHSHEQTLVERREHAGADLVLGYPAMHPAAPENAPLNGLDALYQATAHDWGAIEDIQINGQLGALSEADTRDHRVAADAVEAIGNATAGTPFFMGVGFYLPHNPLYPPQRFLDMYDEQLTGEPLVLPDVLADDLADTTRFEGTSSIRWEQDVFSNPTEWRGLLQAYLASISFVDEKVGEVMAALDASGLRDNTTVVLWSDHGYHLGEKETHGKTTMWRESVLIPMLISSPHHAAQVVDAPVNSVDLMPTLVELAGLTMPTDFPRDGRSLTPLMEDSTSPWPWEGSAQLHRPTADLGIETAVYDENWWFVKANTGESAFVDDRQELYDLATDPNQWSNLVHSAPWSGQVEAVRADLSAKSTGQLLPNDPPSIVDRTIQVESAQHTIDLSATDENGDDLLFTVTTFPAVGTLFRADVAGLGSPITPADPHVNPDSTGQISELVYVANDLGSFEVDGFDVDVSDGSAIAASRITLTSEEPPEVTITTNPAIDMFAAGETLSIVAEATDDRRLRPRNFAWSVELVDNGSTSALPITASGATVEVVVPSDGALMSPNVRIRATVTVTDRDDLVSVDTVELRPRTSLLTFASDGGIAAEFQLDGVPRQVPFGLIGVVGANHIVSVEAEICVGGTLLAFDRWSDGGAIEHQLTVPDTDTTLTAFHAVVGTCNSAMCNELPVTIDLNVTPGATATAGDDVILGTPLADSIAGLGGNDTICGMGGDDTIFGGADNDTILGGAGNDILQGNGGADVLNGDAGEDTLAGNDGDDTLNGGADNDTLYGVAGADTINGDGGADTILGGVNDDIINGGDGDDLISGNAGADTINGDADNDTLYGSTEGDTINGGPGLDIILGGRGNDIIDGGADRDLISGNEDNDTINGGGGDDDLFGVDGADTINGDGGVDLILGGNGADILNGGSEGDLISGNAGADTIDGGDGNDEIYGVNGDDILTGGAGLDIILGGADNDTINSVGDGDIDQVSGQGGTDTCNVDVGPVVFDNAFLCELP